MSRSNPAEHLQNPSTRWFEWNGEEGSVRYYDKDQKKNIEVGSKFDFVLLDELAGVRGWDEDSKSGISSNQVRDTTQESLVVKSFKGGILAQGLYRDIKDRVKASGAKFTANLYLAFKDAQGTLQIGCLQLKGAALGQWMEFRKVNRSFLYTGGIAIRGFVEDKKGKVIFRVPTFKVTPLSEASDAAAKALDKTLQDYLTAYLKKTKTDQADAAAPREDEELPPVDPMPVGDDDFYGDQPDDSEIPF